MPIIISMSLSKEQEKKIKKMQEERLKNGYPKVGTILTATKTGYTYVRKQEKPFPVVKEGHVTAGKQYKVIDNLDLLDGHYHVQSDNGGFCIHLDKKILKQFFGIEMKLSEKEIKYAHKVFKKNILRK